MKNIKEIYHYFNSINKNIDLCKEKFNIKNK